nr:hypothetical protein [Streptomyces sp. 846.5]
MLAWRWNQHELGTELLPAGRQWDVLILPLQQGLLVFGALLRNPGIPGPVLADFDRGQVGFFVPPDAVEACVSTDSRLAGRDTWIVVPRPGHACSRVQWLFPPDGEGTLNEPGALEAALQITAGLTDHTVAKDHRAKESLMNYDGTAMSTDRSATGPTSTDQSCPPLPNESIREHLLALNRMFCDRRLTLQQFAEAGGRVLDGQPVQVGAFADS